MNDIMVSALQFVFNTFQQNKVKYNNLFHKVNQTCIIIHYQMLLLISTFYFRWSLLFAGIAYASVS